MKNVYVVLIAIFSLFCIIQTGQAQEITELIVQGDNAYKSFDNPAALAFYKKAVETDSTHYEALWKLARAYVDVGETLSDKEERKAYYKNAEACAQKSVAINPEGGQRIPVSEYCNRACCP
ncbi:MAG: hypothetical protein JSW33_09325 [bacterium]|nr:MAG: hypothetical protein JSW33_09325 [bacterium]